MQSASAPPTVYPIGHALMRALWYFEIFRHPLTAEELHQYSQLPDVSVQLVKNKLAELVESGSVFQYGQYFQSVEDPGWVSRRHDFNQRADRFLPMARRMARFIGSFPFIRGVFVSGSLSKHCMPPDGDIDFFIITTPGRLWLARTLLVLFKKLFLFNSHKYFCVNYFVDTQHLKIEEQNLFTATEVVTLLPLYGPEWYERFYDYNQWAQKYYPNFPKHTATQIPVHSPGITKKLAERLLNNRFGEWLDKQAMRFTVRYWQRKFSHFSTDRFDNALKSRRHLSKHHPLYFQEKVLAQFNTRAGRPLKPSDTKTATEE